VAVSSSWVETSIKNIRQQTTWFQQVSVLHRPISNGLEAESIDWFSSLFPGFLMLSNLFYLMSSILM
jgi:hypothetical protein